MQIAAERSWLPTQPWIRCTAADSNHDLARTLAETARLFQPQDIDARVLPSRLSFRPLPGPTLYPDCAREARIRNPADRNSRPRASFCQTFKSVPVPRP